MMRHDAKMVSQATGEELPEWLELEKDVVVEGVGDIIVREEDDGTWSLVRQVDGAMPEVEPGHPSQEIAMKLARAYHEGGRIIVERRVSKEIVAAGIRKGMVAKYGGSAVVVIGVIGDEIQILSPDGEDRYVNISELIDVQEVLDPEADPDKYFGDPDALDKTPADMMAGEELTLDETPTDMMAGDEYPEEEGEIKSPEEEALLDELKKLRENEEEEEAGLDGLMVGPPVYFAEIEPTPGLRQSPLGASKTAAVHISQEKGFRPDLRIKPSEMLDLYASIGIPLAKEAHHTKIGEIFFTFDENTGTFRLEDEIVNGSITPMTAEMTEVEAQEVLQNHTDLPATVVAAVLAGAKENGSISIGDRLGYLVKAELLLEPTENGLMVITDSGMAVTDPMDADTAFNILMESTSLPELNLQRAVEMASAGETLVIANVKIAKEAPVCKKCNQRHWPFQPCSGTKPEKEKSEKDTEKEEGKAEDKEAKKEDDKKKEKKDEKNADLEKGDEPATTAGKVRMYFDWDDFYGNVMPQLSNGKFQSAFAEVASTSPEATASQEEQDLYDEELLLLGREASRRKLPDMSKLRFVIGSAAEVENEPGVGGIVIEYRGTDDDVDYLLDMPTGHRVWFKDSELKPTSNPDTTTVPWTERTKKIVDPENKKQDAEFKQELNQKVGQGVDDYLYNDSDLEDAAIAAVEETIPKELITSTAEQLGIDEDPFDVAYNLVQEYKDPLLVSGRRFLPYMAEESVDEEAFMHYARNVVTWELPSPRGEQHEEAMKIGSVAKLKADYETENTELQQLRDLGTKGRIVDLNEKDAAISFGDNVLLIGQSGLEVMGYFFRESTIRRCRPGDRDSKKPDSDQVWCLYAKSTDKVLGRHPSKEAAREQEKAIKAQGAATFLKREAPGPFGGEPGTTVEPAPKGNQISAPPGAPSKGREKTPAPSEVCVCPISGKEVPKQAGVACSSMESPGHPGVKLVDKPQVSPPSPSKKPSAASIETESRYVVSRFLNEYAACIVRRVQSGVLTPADARKEIATTAKEWNWSAKEKKYIKQLLDGKNPDLPESWALASKRPFNREAQSDIATLLKELDRGDAQSTIRSLDDPIEVSNALDGLGWGDDTNDLRQWLIDAPGMTEDILRMYAGDPESANRLVALRAMAERFPQADVSAWLEDDFPFIAEKARDLASGAPSEEVLPSPAPPQIPQIPFVPDTSTQTDTANRHASSPPGSSPPEFPENPESPVDVKEKKTASTSVQLALTHDAPNEQYILYNMDYGLVSSPGADEKTIKGQLRAYGIDDDQISTALKEAKNNIVHIVASKRVAQQGVEQFIYDAVHDAINELSPAAPRANITMKAMDKFAVLTADLGLDPVQFQSELKSVIDAELAQYPRPEIPGTKLEFTQIAREKTGRTYDEKEKKQRIDGLAQHGITLNETFEKEPPEDIPPGRRLSTSGSRTRNGFTVGDRVQDLAMPELYGIVAGFGLGDNISVGMDVSTYCPGGGIGLYLPDGLLNLGPERYAEK